MKKKKLKEKLSRTKNDLKTAEAELAKLKTKLAKATKKSIDLPNAAKTKTRRKPNQQIVAADYKETGHLNQLDEELVNGSSPGE